MTDTHRPTEAGSHCPDLRKTDHNPLYCPFCSAPRPDGGRAVPAVASDFPPRSPEPCEKAEDYIARLPADWFKDSSLERWFPLTAEELKRLRMEVETLRRSSGEPREQWRCFHCHEVFTDPVLAADHFGASEHAKPACQIDAAEYRRMENTVRRFMEEDTDLHRAMFRQQHDHQAALRRAEEAGYAKALKDTGYKEPAQPETKDGKHE